MQWVLVAWVTGLCAGIWAGDLARPPGEPALGAWVWWLSGLLVLLAWGALWKVRRRWARPWPWLMLLGAVMGAGLHVTAPDPRDEAPAVWRLDPAPQAEVFAVVTEGSRLRPHEQHSARVEALRCDGQPCRARLSVFLPEGAPLLASGDLVWLRGLPRASGPREAPYLFDGRRWERAQGLAGSVFVRTPDDLQVRGRAQTLAARLDRWRQGRELWALGLLGDAQAGPLMALVTGSRGLWSASQRAPIDATGLSHVMAISGLHLLVFWALLQRAAQGVVALAPRAFVRRAWLRGLLLELAPLLLMLLYGELVAWPTSAQRAAWMVVGMRSAGWRARRGALGPALAASVGLILLWEGTDALFDPGLQLSVTAVAGLALGGQARQPKGVVGWVLGMAQASLASSAACAPWVAWHFGRLPALGLLLNLLAIPLSEWAMLSAMVGGLLGPGPVGEAALRLAGHAVAFIEALARACPHAGLSVGVAHAPLLALGLVLAALLAWGRRYKAALLATVAATLLGGLWPSDPPGEVVFLPVGQGDAILLLDGQGHSLLVDTGGSVVAGLDPGTRVVRPALLRRGVRRLDVLALSHGDADHTAGAEALIREFRPLEVWAPQDLGALGPAILAAAREVGARVREAPRRARLGGLEVRRVDPPWGPGEATGLSRNEQSVILEVGLRGARFLLTGDAEQAGEARALDELRPVHVLKVAHHGSRTSSGDGFLARARAPIAIVQAGRGNRFGHPHREVVARHWAHGSTVLGTQGCGELSVRVGASVELWGQPGCEGLWEGPSPALPRP